MAARGCGAAWGCECGVCEKARDENASLSLVELAADLRSLAGVLSTDRGLPRDRRRFAARLNAAAIIVDKHRMSLPRTSAESQAYIDDMEAER